MRRGLAHSHRLRRLSAVPLAESRLRPKKGPALSVVSWCPCELAANPKLAVVPLKITPRLPETCIRPSQILPFACDHPRSKALASAHRRQRREQLPMVV